MASPPIVTKGVSKWSLNPDDNATADDRINWQEGQMPSSVNNSARAMMMRIREQHDINQSQFKSILDTVGGRFGNQIKAITADTYTITAAATANNWNFEFHFNDKLTLEEYNAYKAGNLYLLTTLNAPDLVNDSNYKQFSYNSIIYINLYFKIGSSEYLHIMMFKLNFFGIEKTNQTISFHELKEFVNCSTLQVGESNTSTNFVALPMKRTYTSVMDVKPPPYGQATYWWHESLDLVHVVGVVGAPFPASSHDYRHLIPGSIRNIISSAVIGAQDLMVYREGNPKDEMVMRIIGVNDPGGGGGMRTHVVALNNGKNASKFPPVFSPTGIVENLIINVTPTN